MALVQSQSKDRTWKLSRRRIVDLKISVSRIKPSRMKATHGLDAVPCNPWCHNCEDSIQRPGVSLVARSWPYCGTFSVS
jgi:hypothetical protein